MIIRDLLAITDFYENQENRNKFKMKNFFWRSLLCKDENQKTRINLYFDLIILQCGPQTKSTSECGPRAKKFAHPWYRLKAIAEKASGKLKLFARFFKLKSFFSILAMKTTRKKSYYFYFRNRGKIFYSFIKFFL